MLGVIRGRRRVALRLRRDLVGRCRGEAQRVLAHCREDVCVQRWSNRRRGQEQPQE